MPYFGKPAGAPPRHVVRRTATPWWDIRESGPYVVWVIVVAASVGGFGLAQVTTVASMKEKLEKQTKLTAKSPNLQAPTVTRELTKNGWIVHQFFGFSDPEGDANAMSFVILQSDANGIGVESESFQIAEESQIKGTFWRAPWRCEGETYTIKVRAYMSDAGGNVSLPRDYVIDCTAGQRRG